MSLVIVETVRLIWGKIGLTLDPPRALAGAVNLGFTYFPTYRLFVIAVTALVLIGLWLFLEKTNVGLVIPLPTGIHNHAKHKNHPAIEAHTTLHDR